MPYTSANSSGILWPRLFAQAMDLLQRAGPAWITVTASLLLSLLGVYAIDVAESVTPHVPPELSPTAIRQFLFVMVGIVCGIAVLVPNYRLYGQASWVLLGVGIALLVFLLIPFVPSSIVRPRNGARGWIDLGPVDFQPAELVKILYVLVLAWYLRFRRNHRNFKGLLPPAVITAIPVGLITLQPDLGSATLFIPALFAVLVAAGAKLKHLLVIVLIATLAAPAAYPMLKPHQKARIVGLLQQVKGDTRGDQDINMQSVTAQRVAGAGGITGAGNEKSRTLLRFNALPERHTDMVFSVICTRFGLLGGIATLGLYVVWIAGTLMTAAMCREPFGRLVCVGLVGFIAAQLFVNVGMNLGLVPIVGITLPFVSHGGSSMVTAWLMTGLIVNIAIRRPKVALRSSFEYDDDE